MTTEQELVTKATQGFMECYVGCAEEGERVPTTKALSALFSLLPIAAQEVLSTECGTPWLGATVTLSGNIEVVALCDGFRGRVTYFIEDDGDCRRHQLKWPPMESNG